MPAVDAGDGFDAGAGVGEGVVSFMVSRSGLGTVEDEVDGLCWRNRRLGEDERGEQDAVGAVDVVGMARMRGLGAPLQVELGRPNVGGRRRMN